MISLVILVYKLTKEYDTYRDRETKNRYGYFKYILTKDGRHGRNIEQSFKLALDNLNRVVDRGFSDDEYDNS